MGSFFEKSFTSNKCMQREEGGEKNFSFNCI